MSEENERGEKNKLAACLNFIELPYTPSTVALLCTCVQSAKLTNLCVSYEKEIIHRKVFLTAEESFEAVACESVLHRSLEETFNIFLLAKLSMVDEILADKLYSILVEEARLPEWANLWLVARASLGGNRISNRMYEKFSFGMFSTLILSADILETDTFEQIKGKFPRAAKDRIKASRILLRLGQLARAYMLRDQFNRLCAEATVLHSLYLQERWQNKNVMQDAKLRRQMEKDLRALQDDKTYTSKVVNDLKKELARVKDENKELSGILSSKSYIGQYETKIKKLTVLHERALIETEEIKTELEKRNQDLEDANSELSLLREQLSAIKLEAECEVVASDVSFKHILGNRPLVVLGGRESWRRNFFAKLQDEGVFYKCDAVSRSGKSDTPMIFAGSVVVFNVDGISHAYFSSQIETLRALDIVLITTQTQNLNLLGGLIEKELLKSEKA